MSHLLYISHMLEDSAFVAELASALGDSYRLTTNMNSPNIDVAFFVLTYAYIVNEARGEEARVLIGRNGIWCIPLFYHLWLHDVVNMANLPEAKPFWKALKNLNGVEFDRRESLPQYAKKVAEVVRKGPQSGRLYGAFLSHASEVKGFCKELKQQLEQRDVACFLDQDNIRGGPGRLKFSEEIHAALKSSKVLVVVLSHHFQSKEWTVKEVSTCKALQGTVLPVYYQISREQCLQQTVNYTKSKTERDALLWLHQQPGIEHFGLHGGIQPRKAQLIEDICGRVLRLQ